MCLGDIAQVVEVVDEKTVLARIGHREVTISMLTLEGPVVPGEWLQVHSGFALGRVTDEERREAERIRTTSEEEERCPPR